MFSMLMFLVLIFFKTTELNAFLFSCSSKVNCGDCVQSTVLNLPCRWCNRNSKCHTPGSLLNPCKRAENVIEKSHCDDKFSTYDPKLSMKMLLLSAAAYDTSDPQECLNNSLPSANFQIQRVVSKKCDSHNNNCSGYVAISHDLKAIVVAFRGSVDTNQTINIFLTTLREPKEKFLHGLDGEVQTYWKRGFEKLWPYMEEQVKDLVSNNPPYQVWITGHSLGGALASLASTWLSYKKVVSRKNLILYTFGMPRVGNLQYAYEHDVLVNNSWRVVNYNDSITQFPTLVSPNMALGNNPYHHGIEVYYMVKATSPYSKHKECHGKPYNEDITCSYKTLPDMSDLDFPLHKIYFSIPVGTFCETSRHKTDTGEIPTEIYQNRSSGEIPNELFHNKTSSVCSSYECRNVSYSLVSKEFHTGVSNLIFTFALFLLLIII